MKFTISLTLGIHKERETPTWTFIPTTITESKKGGNKEDIFPPKDKNTRGKCKICKGRPTKHAHKYCRSCQREAKRLYMKKWWATHTMDK